MDNYIISVPHANKHLIKFPIALDYSPLRDRTGHSNSMEYGAQCMEHGSVQCSCTVYCPQKYGAWCSIWCSCMVHSPQSVLLKADTGANVNLMNRKTFDELFGQARGVLQLTPIRMENYRNTAVKVLVMFCAFLRWKDKVYKQLFYMMDCDRSPNLLSRDACYTLGVLKPCFNLENSIESTHASNKGDVAAKSFLHQKMSGSEKKLSNNSHKCSILERQLQGSPLTKQDILDIYSDVFTRIGKFPGLPYKFQLKPNAKPTRHSPRKVPIHLQDTFHNEIRNLQQLGILARNQRHEQNGSTAL